ncbi:histidine kinase [Vibrio galatheae]|uniref:Histidine kinase n=1 Tax=Vibrio galatheae TaxID=579748 RepID=A0A0F4NIT3_9VIBR|nr:DNA internalization-related competence protein ComEC/Rec2 [Vibrio galatheae]KJY83027.1 histidine kinase [Vibrio galatheae]
MTLYIYYWTLISFSLLITTSPYWPIMPQLDYLPIALIALVVSIKYRKAKGLLGLALAFVVILMHGNMLRFQTETLFQAGQDITITADINSFFRPINFGYQGIVVVRSINGESLTRFAQPTIRLNSPVDLQLGETISARVTVKPIYGLLNTVGYDAEKMALVQGVVGTAAINTQKSYYIINTPSIRANLIQSVTNKTNKIAHQGMILALMFGEREKLTAEDWQRLKFSGLSHLVAISGLHIGIAFGIGWSVGLMLLKASARFLSAPILVGLLCAISYAWLAGFSLPTQRAAMMCAIICVLQLLAGGVPKSLKWLVVLSLLLLIEPFSTQSASLWMSMTAVGAIFLYQSFSRPHPSLVMKLMRMQLFLMIIMSPIVISLFQGISLGTIAYNLVFVPWFSLVVIPLVFVSFIGHLFSPGFEYFWLGLNLSLQLVDWCVQYAEWMWIDVSRLSLMWFVAGIGWLVMSHVFSLRTATLLIVCFGLIQLNWREKPLWKMTVFDVGHGLSVLVQQDDSAMLYDTGVAWTTSSIVGQIVGPFMRAEGIQSLDYFVVSHFDSDHAGGFDDVITQWNPRYIITSQNKDSHTPCVEGQTWQWNAMQIQALWPPQVARRAYNPHSCVLRLSHRESSTELLLTGDIEAIAEWILARKPDRLAADIVVVPHHGSKTSSTAGFVTAVSPKVAVASLAKGNRWRLPSDAVVNRYREIGAIWKDTGSSGQILFEIYPQRFEVSGLRESKGKSWYRQMLRNGVE